MRMSLSVALQELGQHDAAIRQVRGWGACLVLAPWIGRSLAVLHLGGDLGNFKHMLRPAGCSKKSQKIQGCDRVTPLGISVIFWGPPTHLYTILNN